MQAQRAEEEPHDAGPAAVVDAGAGEGAEAVRVHVVGCDFIVAHVGLDGEGENESELFETRVSTVSLSVGLVGI